ncbi:hypothetical protein MRX96_023754 [Rhipicephalus microplus]
MRRFGASLAMPLVLLGEEHLERFLRLTLKASVAAASLVEKFSLADFVASAVFCNFRTTMVVMGFSVCGSADASLSGRPRGCMATGASLKGPGASSLAEAWRFGHLAFRELWMASADLIAMASSLQVWMSLQRCRSPTRGRQEMALVDKKVRASNEQFTGAPALTE